MTLYELIEHIHARGIRIDTRDGRLGITADEADLGDEVTAALKAFRKEVWACFHDEPVQATGLEHPLSFAQRRLYFLYHYDRGATHFNLPVELALEGPLDAAALQRAVQAVLAGHPIYRTTYFLADGVPRQRHEPQRAQALPCIDLAALPAAAQEARLAEARAQLAGTPFDLEAELPLRLRCFENWLTERIRAQGESPAFLTEVGAVTYLQRPQSVLNIRGLFELLDGVRDLKSALDTPINRGLALETLFRRLER